MEIIDLLNYNEIRFETAIALGNFDGLHIGHQELIKAMVENSKKIGLKSSLLLFKTHTKSIINKKTPNMLTNNEQKFRIAEELGVDIIYLLDFDESVMRLTGEEFVKEILLKKMNGKLLVCGFDYRFGYKASGDSNYLRELGDQYGIDLIVLEPVHRDSNVISSSLIRDLINNGEVKHASELLGRYYSIIGEVISGSNRGNKLGFPTANIEPIADYVMPKTGVYITNSILNNKRYISATNIGYNPTFNEENLKIETYILDFNEDIYGETLEIEFIDFLRDDIKFNNVEDLIEQINLDIEAVKSRY